MTPEAARAAAEEIIPEVYFSNVSCAWYWFGSKYHTKEDAELERQHRVLDIASIIMRHAGGWQDIASAPRDNSWVLGLMRNGRTQTVIRWGGGTWEDDNRLCRDPIAFRPLPAPPERGQG